MNKFRKKKPGGENIFIGMIIAIVIVIVTLIPVKNNLNNIADNIEIKSKVKVEATVDKNEKTTKLKTTVFSIDFTQHDLVDKYESEISYSGFQRKYTDKVNYEELLGKKAIHAYLYTITLKEKNYKILSVNEELEKDDIVFLKKELNKK